MAKCAVGQTLIAITGFTVIASSAVTKWYRMAAEAGENDKSNFKGLRAVEFPPGDDFVLALLASK